MKKVIFYLCFALAASNLFAQATKTIALNPPDTSRGLPVMKALKLRASATKYDTATLKTTGYFRPAMGCQRGEPSCFGQTYGSFSY